MANRITGLASGMDVDNLVKEMMKARRTSYDNMIKNARSWSGSKKITGQ